MREIRFRARAQASSPRGESRISRALQRRPPFATIIQANRKSRIARALVFAGWHVGGAVAIVRLCALLPPPPCGPTRVAGGEGYLLCASARELLLRIVDDNAEDILR